MLAIFFTVAVRCTLASREAASGKKFTYIKVAGYQINDIHDLASSYTFIAIGICADGVSVCS